MYISWVRVQLRYVRAGKQVKLIFLNWSRRSVTSSRIFMRLNLHQYLMWKRLNNSSLMSLNLLQ